MKKQFVDCFMLMGAALSSNGAQKLPEMSRPLLQDVFTTFVNISLLVNELKIISGPSLNLEIDLFLTQKWVDPRLGANFKTRKMAAAGQIWKPKIFNINGDGISCNSDDTAFWRGFGNEGNVVLSEKLKLTVACTENYRNYPFDTQICAAKFGSYRFPFDEVAILWDINPVWILDDSLSNQFRLINVTTIAEQDLRLFGNFSVGIVEFVLKRNSRHYLNCMAVPCLLITLLNYLSLWLDLNNRSIRLQINLATFGLFLGYYYISFCLIQPTPYFKALDIFVAISTLFSLATLFEILVLDRFCTEEESLYHLKKIACNREYPKFITWIEFAFKLAYPVFYLFFLIVYSLIFVDFDEIK